MNNNNHQLPLTFKSLFLFFSFFLFLQKVLTYLVAMNVRKTISLSLSLSLSLLCLHMTIFFPPPFFPFFVFFFLFFFCSIQRDCVYSLSLLLLLFIINSV